MVQNLGGCKNTWTEAYREAIWGNWWLKRVMSLIQNLWTQKNKLNLLCTTSVFSRMLAIAEQMLKVEMASRNYSGNRYNSCEGKTICSGHIECKLYLHIIIVNLHRKQWDRSHNIWLDKETSYEKSIIN